jgi:F420-0:gamma-glutamyl ligase-like protein
MHFFGYNQKPVHYSFVIGVIIKVIVITTLVEYSLLNAMFTTLFEAPEMVISEAVESVATAVESPFFFLMVKVRVSPLKSTAAPSVTVCYRVAFRSTIVRCSSICPGLLVLVP